MDGGPPEQVARASRRHVFVVDENVIKVELDGCIPRGEQAYLFASARCLEALTPANALRFELVELVERFEVDALGAQLDAIFSPAQRGTLHFVTNDECVEVVLAQLRERYALAGAGIERASLWSDKVRMKAALRGVVRCPEFARFCPQRFAADGGEYLRELVRAVGLPLVVKPTDGTSGSGVEIVHSLEGLAHWARSHARVENCEVESFIRGTLYPVDSLICGGEVLQVLAGEGAVPCLEYASGRSMVVRAVGHESPIFARLRRFNEAVVAALRPPDGALHMEVFEDESGELVFVEASARPGGGELRWVHAHYNGVDIEAAHFRLRTGLGYEHVVREGPPRSAMFCVFPRRSGRVTQLHSPRVRSQCEGRWTIAVGEELRPAQDLASPSAGVLRLHSDIEADIEADFEILAQFVPYTVVDAYSDAQGGIGRGRREPRLIGYACGVGSEHERSSEGPAGLAEFLVERPDSAPGRWPWQAIVGVDSTLRGLRSHAARDTVAATCEGLARESARALREGAFPVVVGGDHSCGIGTWSGVARSLREAGGRRLGLLWFDAHMDSHTPDSTPSGYCHGMPVAALLGHYGPEFGGLLDGDPVLRPETVVLIGIRDYESQERRLLEALGVRVYYIEEVRDRGLSAVVDEALGRMNGHIDDLGVSVDLDGLDPRFAPAVGTPVSGGLDREALLAVLRRLARDPRLVAVEFAEFNPSLDREHQTHELLVELLSALEGEPTP